MCKIEHGGDIIESILLCKRAVNIPSYTDVFKELK